MVVSTPKPTHTAFNRAQPYVNCANPRTHRGNTRDTRYHADHPHYVRCGDAAASRPPPADTATRGLDKPAERAVNYDYTHKKGKQQ